MHSTEPLAHPGPVAYQGQPGAYSEQACRSLVGDGATLLPCPTLEQVFAALADGTARSAVVPIENTLAGAVPGVVGLLLASTYSVIAETIVAIDHVLAAPAGVTVADVTRVLSHPVALAQCQGFFRQHPAVTALPVFDTAGAMEMVMQNSQPGDAAIASRRAATLYGATIVAENIQDHPLNFTRFVHIDSQPAAMAQGACKVMLAFRLRHEPGALAGALLPLAHAGLNLTRIDSRPVAGRPFEYEFLAEATLQAGIDVETALDRVRPHMVAMRTIGAFAQAGPVVES